MEGAGGGTKACTAVYYRGYWVHYWVYIRDSIKGNGGGTKVCTVVH